MEKRVPSVLWISIRLSCVGCANKKSIQESPCYDEKIRSSHLVESDSDDISIYRTIATQIGGAEYVIQGIQVTWPPREEDSVHIIMEFLRKEIPNIDPSIWESFQEKQDALLDTCLMRNKMWVFEKKEFIDSIFEKDKGWNKFYELFPKAHGILTFSVIKYNKGKTEALVYAGNQLHWLAGTGYYYYMKNNNGEWKILKKVMSWIS